jgi:hypothetical protein
VAAAIVLINLRQTMVDLPVFPEREGTAARYEAGASHGHRFGVRPAPNDHPIGTDAAAFE